MKTIQVRIEKAQAYTNGWTVAKARFEGPSPSESPISKTGDLFALVGAISVKRGDVVSVTGEWSTHERYGLQFKASLCVPVVNNSEAGVVAFLDRLPQIGPIRARQLIRALGPEGVVAALESDPGKLACVPGIDQARAEAIAVAFREERDLYESFVFISGLGFEQQAVAGALKLWGRTARAIVACDPYQLLEVDGLGFEAVDGVARSRMGVGLDDPRRCAAGFRLALSELTQAGHTWAPAPALCAEDPQSPLSKRVAEKVKMSPEHLRIGLGLASSPHYRKAEGGRESALAVVDDLGRVWHEPSMSAEMSIAAHLHRLATSPEFKPIDTSGVSIDPALSEEQKRAVESVLTRPVTVITSGPGCGKTFSVNAAVQVLEGAGLNVALCAPTGKAAQRMKDLAGGHEATTIHRLLGNVLEPTEISAQVVVGDELSMADVHLFAALVGAIQDGSRLVIVGDVDQLPSIGPGAVLSDLIESGSIAVARLTKIFRQASESYIPYLARAINLGEPPDVATPRPDVAFVELDNENLAESVVQAFLGLAADGGPESVIVCVPQRNKSMGVENLNRQLQAAFVPDGEALWIGGQYQARVGDRVVHKENDYELLTSIGPGVFNGELGMVEALDFAGLPEHVVREAGIHEGYQLRDGRTDRVAVVRFPDKTAVYNKLQVRKLHLGWALTVHACVTLDTLVETSDGLRRMTQIPETGVVATPDGPRPYEGFFVRSEGPVVRIETKGGYTITVTPDHGFDVWMAEGFGRKEASALAVGDILRLRLGSTIEPSVPQLPPLSCELDVRARMHDLPRFLTGDLAELLGLLVADGTVTPRGTVRWIKRHEDVVARGDGLARVSFGVEPRRIDGELVAEAFGAEFCSVQIARWLFEHGGCAPNAKRVPDCILRAPLKLQARFLRGLFEDGTANLKGAALDHVEWHNKNEEVVQTVQTLLLRFGIISARRIKTYTTLRGFDYVGWSLYIYGANAKRFAAKIGFVSSWKNARLGAPVGRESRYWIPLSCEEYRTIEGLAGSMTKTEQNTLSTGRMSRAVAADLALRLGGNPLLAQRLGWHYARVARLEETVAATACVTVPDGHRFLQNGFSGWNCQGSQADSVIFVCSTEHAYMNDRALLYTACTRSVKRLLILGQQAALNRAVTSTFRKQRMTGLAEFLRDRFQSEEK